MKLAAFALQAEKGDSSSHRSHYFKPSDYLPLRAIVKLKEEYIKTVLPTMHAKHHGMNRETAELEFLKASSAYVIECIIMRSLEYWLVSRLMRILIC